MMHTTLKFLKCRWLKFEQNCRCQNKRKLSVLWKFLSILCLATMFYIIYISRKSLIGPKMSNKANFSPGR